MEFDKYSYYYEYGCEDDKAENGSGYVEDAFKEHVVAFEVRLWWWRLIRSRIVLAALALK